MDESLQQLCDILDRELERQENVRGLCIAQREAVRTRDVAGIEARAAAIQLLVRDVVHAEMERHAVLRRLVQEMGLPSSEQTLTGLIQRVPAPWKSRLEFYQTRLQTVMHETRTVARETSLLLRRSLRVVGRSLQVFQQGGPSGSRRYTDRGEQTAAVRSVPAFINQRG